MAAPDRHTHHLSRKGRIVAYLGGLRPAYPGWAESPAPGWASVAPAGRHLAPSWTSVAPGRPASGTRVGFRQADARRPRGGLQAGQCFLPLIDIDRSQRPRSFPAPGIDRCRPASSSLRPDHCQTELQHHRVKQRAANRYTSSTNIRASYFLGDKVKARHLCPA